MSPLPLFAASPSVTYSVSRAINNGPFELLDSMGTKKFVDETVPVGTRSVAYMVKASRGERSSAWSSAFEMRFGRVAGNAGAAAMKIAT